MSGSLKDELLKLGFRSTKPAEPARRKAAERKPKPAPTPPVQKRTVAPAAPAAKPVPSAREQRDAERERARRQASAFEQLEANKLDDAQAEIKHYYSTGRKIKYTYVTEAQQKALLAGEIVIVVAQGKGRLVPNSLLPALRAIDPDVRIVDPHAKSDDSDGDPEHQVPDDLRW